mgnify:CR=1 FL=1
MSDNSDDSIKRGYVSPKPPKDHGKGQTKPSQSNKQVKK